MSSPEQKTCSRSLEYLVHTCEHCPAQPYVQLKLPKDLKRVQRVSFTLEARDQGWADSSTEESSAWFDAVVRRPEGRKGINDLVICRNAVATGEFGEMVHTWDNTSHKYKAWLEELQAGDTLQVIPKAVYTGWVNIIRKASIELTYEVVGQTTSRGPRRSYHNKFYWRALHEDKEDGHIIRIFVVDPGNPDDDICGHLQYVDLDDCDPIPHFDAISYCHTHTSGDSTTIYIWDDVRGEYHPFTVSQTVAAVIRRLRDEEDELRIWIDAICINQADETEKERQVCGMKAVYERARTVHIWLGEGNGGYEAALQVVRDIYNANSDEPCPGGRRCDCNGIQHSPLDWPLLHRQSGPSIQGVFDQVWGSFSPAGKRAAAADQGENAFRCLMRHLFEHPWFRRVWVIQEALSAQNALVHYGWDFITWNELVKVNMMLEDDAFQKQWTHFRGQFTLPEIWTTIEVALEGEGSAPCVLEVFLKALDMKATEPRDRLYATVKFGRDWMVPSHNTSNCPGRYTITRSLRPDYKQSLGHVMARLTRWWIKKYGSLMVLSFIHTHPARTWRRVLCHGDPTAKTGPKQPTWALSTQGRYQWTNATLVRRFSFFAAGDSRPDPRLLDVGYISGPESLVLRLLGCTAGEIAALGYPPEDIVGMDDDGGDDDNSRKWTVAGISRVFDAIIDPCGRHNLWTDPIDRKSEEVETPGQWHQRYEEHVRAHQICSPTPTLFSVRPSRKGDGFRWYPVEHVPACVGECFFLDSEGRRGLCPWTARVGDVIAILNGGKVPYLLRPAPRPKFLERDSRSERHDADYSDWEDGGGSYFELVGECYVEGLMDGRYFERKGHQQEEFVLV